MHEQVRKVEPSRWVAEHGDLLYAYALKRLSNADSAEEVVQEAFLGALRSLSQAPPQGNEGPWLMGILKKKVADRLRKDIKQGAAIEDSDPIIENLFDEKGNWSMASRKKGAFHLDKLEQSEFADILENCLQGLPPNQASVFVGREVQEKNAEEICKELGISSTNLWVLMHRARLRLAECIRSRWALGDA